MARPPRRRLLALLLLGMAVAPIARATEPNAADHPMRQFLSQDDSQPPYRALRRLEAANGNRMGWLEAVTEFSVATGFRYEVTSEGGSEYIRDRVLKAVLDGEREVIAQGEAGRSSLALANYSFEANGLDAEGLANVLLSPRRKERALVSGTLFLQPTGGDLVRLQGRLAKSPSFWVKNVDIVRTYDRIADVVVPVALDTKAQVRFLGDATLRMTYRYSEIAGRPVTSGR